MVKPTDPGSAVPPGKPLVVGVDWTDGSQHALEWAAALARRIDRELELVHASSPWVGLEMAIPPFDYERYRRAVEEAMETWSAKIADVDHASRITEDEPARALLVAAEATDPGMIVLGGHDRSSWMPHHLGSVASKVLHSSQWPVVIVPVQTPIEAPHGRLVVGVDGSESSLEALRWATGFAGLVDSRIYAVCVVPFEPFAERPRLAGVETSDPVGDTMSNLRALTDDLAGRTEVNIESDVLIGDPASRLVNAGDSAELLILGTAGHRESQSNALGATTRSCVTHSSAPVVVVPWAGRGGPTANESVPGCRSNAEG